MILIPKPFRLTRSTGCSHPYAATPNLPRVSPVVTTTQACRKDTKHDQEAKPSGNRRNGKSKKTLKGDFGEIEIVTPRDREATFEPRSEEHTSELQSPMYLVCR